MKSAIVQLNTFEHRRDVFWLAAAVIGICACTYIYCVTATIQNIVSNKNLSSQAGNMKEVISTKQFEYINLENKVTESYARSLGFVDASEKTFIKPASVSFVSSNTLPNTIQ